MAGPLRVECRTRLTPSLRVDTWLTQRSKKARLGVAVTVLASMTEMAAAGEVVAPVGRAGAMAVEAVAVAKTIAGVVAAARFESSLS